MWKSSEVTASLLQKPQLASQLIWTKGLELEKQKKCTCSIMTIVENEVFGKAVGKSLSLVNHLNFNMN